MSLCESAKRFQEGLVLQSESVDPKHDGRFNFLELFEYCSSCQVASRQHRRQLTFCDVDQIGFNLIAGSPNQKIDSAPGGFDGLKIGVVQNLFEALRQLAFDQWGDLCLLEVRAWIGARRDESLDQVLDSGGGNSVLGR